MLGLVVMQAAYGFMVLLGLFSLAGIVINNGIVLIDRIEIEQAQGREPLDAAITACLARLRPILMTTLTTVLGLVPLILFGGALFFGMASVIAFGLIVATVFTLGFVPVLYLCSTGFVPGTAQALYPPRHSQSLLIRSPMRSWRNRGAFNARHSASAISIWRRA